MVESDVTRSRSRDRKIERFIHFTSSKHRNLTPKTLSRQYHDTIVDRTYVFTLFLAHNCARLFWRLWIKLQLESNNFVISKASRSDSSFCKADNVIWTRQQIWIDLICMISFVRSVHEVHKVIHWGGNVCFSIKIHHLQNHFNKFRLYYLSTWRVSHKRQTDEHLFSIGQNSSPFSHATEK